MKKRVLALVICFCLTIGAVVSASGSASQSNVLISKGYLEGAFYQELQNMILQRISDADVVLTNAYVDGVKNLGQAQLDKLMPDDEDTQWLTAGSFKLWSGEYDDTIVLAMGAGLVWSRGSAVLLSGTLIDLTTGVEIGVGDSPVAGHRYVAAEEATITIVGITATWSAEGQLRTTAEKAPEPEPEPEPEEPTPVLQFTDVPTDIWYYDAVCYVVERGLFKGTSDTTFDPLKSMNRAMLATVIYRMSESPETIYNPVFSDVPDGIWYSSAIVWAAGNGIVNGMGNGMYQPMTDLSREQIAVLLYNYANWLGLDTSARADLSAISDGNTVSVWAADAMSWSVAIGLFQGDTNGMLNPRGSATRAAVALLLQRFEQLQG